MQCTEGIYYEPCGRKDLRSGDQVVVYCNHTTILHGTYHMGFINVAVDGLDGGIQQPIPENPYRWRPRFWHRIYVTKSK